VSTPQVQHHLFQQVCVAMAAYHPSVAVVTQQPPDPPGLVVVVYVQPSGFWLSSAQRTPAFLKLQLVIVLARSDLVQLL
jgi:hypothetical protein